VTSSGSRTAGVKPAPATISAIFLIPRRETSSPLPLRRSGRRAMPLPSACIINTSPGGPSGSIHRASAGYRFASRRLR